MDRDDDGETSYKYNTFVDDVAFEPTYLQALPTAAGRNVATLALVERHLSQPPIIATHTVDLTYISGAPPVPHDMT